MEHLAAEAGIGVEALAAIEDDESTFGQAQVIAALGLVDLDLGLLPKWQADALSAISEALPGVPEDLRLETIGMIMTTLGRARRGGDPKDVDLGIQHNTNVIVADGADIDVDQAN